MRTGECQMARRRIGAQDTWAPECVATGGGPCLMSGYCPRDPRDHLPSRGTWSVPTTTKYRNPSATDSTPTGRATRFRRGQRCPMTSRSPSSGTVPPPRLSGRIGLTCASRPRTIKISFDKWHVPFFFEKTTFALSWGRLRWHSLGGWPGRQARTGQSRLGRSQTPPFRTHAFPYVFPRTLCLQTPVATCEKKKQCMRVPLIIFCLSCSSPNE